MNPYESGTRKAIPAVLIYPRRGGKTLMLHRNTRPDDYHLGKWNGLGGKCEADESFLETACRELTEEAGISLPPSCFQALGWLQFPSFKPHKSEDWLVTVFVADLPPGVEPSGGCNEGELSWIPDSELLGLKLWAGDREFLPYVLRREPFQGTLWYQGDELKRHAVISLAGGLKQA